MRYVAPALLAILVVLALSCGGDAGGTPSASPTQSNRERQTAQVYATVSGDVFDAVVGVKRVRYRIAGVRAPREDECYAQQSLEASTGLLLGEVIEIEELDGPEVDGALPASATLAGAPVDEQLLRLGLARAVPPASGDEPEARLVAAEAEARASAIGLWGSCIVPPYGFTVETVVSGLEAPTAVAFAPDGRLFVAEKAGKVWIIDDEGVKSAEPFIDLTAEVNGQHDRGLLSLAFDPGFSSNGYVYLLYTVDPVPGEPDEDPDTPAFGRLTRYTSAAGRADPASRKIILGETAADAFPLASVTHTIADLVFASDGTLFVSAGDGAVDTIADVGHGLTDRDIAFSAMFPPEEDIGSLRAQSLDSMDGKILRIDPQTGGGVASNPFWTGDPTDNQSRIFALGMRNPFRIALLSDDPGEEALIVADVGNKIAEEVSIARAGSNLGWPCYEGTTLEPAFAATAEASAVCGALDPASLVEPLIEYPHVTLGGSAEFTGSAIIGGDIYTGRSFPPEYDGAYFFSDLSGGFMKAVKLDDTGALAGMEDFATGLSSPVQIKMNPATGELYVVAIAAGEILRIRYNGEG